MSNKKDITPEDNGYLFTVEVLVKGQTNGHALEKLTKLLNEESVTDYRILKGIYLGQVIEAAIALAEQNNSKAAPSKKTDPAAGGASKKEAKTESKAEVKTDCKTGSAKSESNSFIDPINQYMEERKLVRLSINKGKGVKLSIPCRILNYDQSANSITIYHVDEKKVYSFQLTEIDDLISS